MPGRLRRQGITFPRCKQIQAEGERRSIKTGTNEINESFCPSHFRVEWVAGTRLPNPGKRVGVEGCSLLCCAYIEIERPVRRGPFLPICLMLPFTGEA